jgi:hypothetical protein
MCCNDHHIGLMHRQTSVRCAVQAWGLFTAASIKAFDMIAASAAEQKRLLALRRQPEQQPGHEERDGLMADSTTTASTTTTSSSSSSSSVGAAEVLAEAPSAGAARNNDGAADTSSSSSSRRPASSKLPRVESRGAGGALEAPNLSSPVWPLWHLGLTQADLAFCVYAFGSVFYHPTPWVEALARLAGELKDNCTPFVLVPILAALLHGRCEDEPLLRSLGDVSDDAGVRPVTWGICSIITASPQRVCTGHVFCMLPESL